MDEIGSKKEKTFRMSHLEIPQERIALRRYAL